MNPLVSIVIINWNGENELTDCLTSLFKQDYPDIEIIIFDNNSQDNSVNLISSKFPRVKLIQHTENIGFANGCNKAIQYAKGKYIMLFNNDAYTNKSLVSLLVKQLESDISISVVQPKIIYRGNNLYIDNTINSIGAYLTVTGFLYYPGYGKRNLKKYNRKSPIFSALGACMMIRSEIIKETELFDPDFFMYFEESDFCARVWLYNKKVVYLPDAIVYHKGGVSARKFGNDIMTYHSFKNRICSYIKNLQLINLIPLLILHLFICESTAVVYLCMGKIYSFLAIEKAVFWNIINLKNTLKKRKNIQNSIRRINDADYWQYIMRNPKLSYYLYLFTGLQYYKD